MHLSHKSCGLHIDYNPSIVSLAPLRYRIKYICTLLGCELTIAPACTGSYTLWSLRGRSAVSRPAKRVLEQDIELLGPTRESFESRTYINQYSRSQDMVQH